MLAGIRANPRPFVLVVVGMVILGAFFAVVAPLFDTGGLPAAQIAGEVPATATAGRQLEVDVGFDNQGTTVLRQACVQASVRGPLAPDYAVFQGVDREVFRNGLVCGGSLSGQETISIRVFLRATAPGTAHLALTPVAQSKALGSGIAGTVHVVA